MCDINGCVFKAEIFSWSVFIFMFSLEYLRKYFSFSAIEN